jgi:hypothetical protein
MDPTVSAAYLLRSYTWQLLKNNMSDVWDEDKYGGLTPIVPLSEEPELDEFSGPHIVYGFADDATGSLHARNSGSMTFAIYDDNFRRLGKTMNILKTAFERQDEAAADVNIYTSTIPQFIGIRFGTIDIGFTEGGTPEELEGGRQTALINLRYEYYVDYDVKTTIAEWV